MAPSRCGGIFRSSRTVDTAGLLEAVTIETKNDTGAQGCATGQWLGEEQKKIGLYLFMNMFRLIT